MTRESDVRVLEQLAQCRVIGIPDIAGTRELCDVDDPNVAFLGS